MKKLFPDIPDVQQNVANRAVRIIEKHLRVHRVSRASELPEEAKVRLYRDLRFYFEGDSNSTGPGAQREDYSLRGLFSRFWEKLGDFLSASEANHESRQLTVFSWVFIGESARLVAMPWQDSACDESC